MKVNIGRYPKGNSKRRIKIEVDNFDSWSLDSTMSWIILPVLIQLKYSMQGVPADFTKAIGNDVDGNYCFDFIKDDEDEVFNKGCEAWETAIDKMIWSFYQLSLDDEFDSKYHHGRMETEWKESDHTYPNPITGKIEKTFEMIDKNPDDHWYDRVGHELHEKRIQEGLDLFAKYYRALWD